MKTVLDTLSSLEATLATEETGYRGDLSDRQRSFRALQNAMETTPPDVQASLRPALDHVSAEMAVINDRLAKVKKQLRAIRRSRKLLETVA